MTTFAEGGSGTTTNVYDSQGRVVTQRDPLGQEMTFDYSAGHTVVTDAAGTPLTYTYSSEGVLTAVTDALGHTTSYRRDNDYNLKRVTDARGYSTYYTYNDCGCAVASVEDALGNTTSNVYDGHNNLLATTDPLTHTTHFAYDGADNLVAITNTLGYTSTFAYDAQGQLIAATDARGNSSTFGYDDYGNLTAITDTLGHVTAMAYDLSGHVTAVTDAREHTTTFDYDALGRLITSTDALEGQAVRAYDAAGHLTGLTDANGHATAFAYDDLGRLITVTDALQGHTIYAYDPVGRVTAVTDANGRSAHMAYDVLGRLITATDALEGETVFAYDAVGNVTCVTKAGRATSFAYDALNRTVAITDALGHATWLGYDALGNVTQRADPTNVLVQYGYDAASRLEDVTGPLGLLAQYTYDPAGNIESLTDANGHATHYGYDELNLLASVLDAVDGLTEYTYDPVGNLETVSDARQHVTHYAYDELDRLLTVTDPLDHVTAYGYDPVGNTTVITDADGGVTALAYDALDRLLQVDYPDSAVEYGYDPVGNRLAMTDTTGVTTYEYDALYRPLTITAPYVGAVGYRYDALGRRTQTLYPGGESVAYTYDDASRLTQVADYASGVTTYTYDDAGRVLGALLPNGVQTGYEYDDAGRLTAIQHEHGSDWLTRYEYGLDAAGNRVAITETTTAVRAYGLPALGRGEGTGSSGGASSVGGWPLAQRITYGYDDTDRLTDAQYNNGDRYEYGYDPVGNRTALTVTAQAVEVQETAYAYDDADRLTTVDGVPYTYDNRGNLTSDGAWTYTYDGAGRMVCAESITATTVYTYNGDGLLVAEAQDGVETGFTWDQALALPQVLGTCTGERDVYGFGRIGVLQSGAWYYRQSDALGSVRQWTDALGVVAALQAYGPYGGALAPLGPPPAAWGYTGEWQDPAAMVYLRARWYNPALGRFLQADPFRGLLSAPATLHPYLYALADPLAYTDRAGLLPPAPPPPWRGAAWTWWETHTALPWLQCLYDKAEWSRLGVSYPAVAAAYLRAEASSWGWDYDKRINAITDSIVAALPRQPNPGTEWVVRQAIVSGLEGRDYLEEACRRRADQQASEWNRILMGVLSVGLLGASLEFGPDEYQVETNLDDVVVDQYRKAQNPRVQNAINKLYRPGGVWASGSTADAVLGEGEYDEPIQGKWHTEKALGFIQNLRTILREEQLSESDFRIVLRMLKDLLEATNLHWGKGGSGMTLDSDNLVEKMLAAVPAVRPNYDQYMVWCHGEKESLHVILGSVLSPYLEGLLDSPHEEQALRAVFAFLEDMATSEDEHVVNVLWVTNVEPICFLSSEVVARARALMGPATRKALDEMQEGWSRLDEVLGPQEPSADDSGS